MSKSVGANPMNPTNEFNCVQPVVRMTATHVAPYEMCRPSLQKRILVIDNNDDTRRTLCHQLTALGFEPVAEDSGISGLARVAYGGRTSPIRGLLVELDLPLLGGMAVLQEMSDRFPSVPVIVMSHALHMKKLRHAMKMGAKEYLVKPFDSELVRRKCRKPRCQAGQGAGTGRVVPLLLVVVYCMLIVERYSVRDTDTCSMADEPRW
jgi:CheY-like chemotaxis protein